MQTMTLEEAQSHLCEIIDKLSPGEEVVLTRDDKTVARIVAAPVEKSRPVLGRGKGMLTVISEDDDHLKDFPERENSAVPTSGSVLEVREAHSILDIPPVSLGSVLHPFTVDDDLLDDMLKGRS